MRTTLDIPDKLLHEALRASHAKTKTMVVVLGLQELINRHKLDQLRALRGQVEIMVDLQKTRDRRG